MKWRPRYYSKRRVIVDLEAWKSVSEAEVCTRLQAILRKHCDWIGFGDFRVQTIRVKQWSRVKSWLRRTNPDCWP